jgi:DNA ligase-1
MRVFFIKLIFIIIFFQKKNMSGTLYKQTKTGAIEFWSIKTEGASIITTYGQLNTEHPQTTIDVIKQGKNKNKSNATTPESQAIAEASSKWTQKVKEGYVISIEKATAGEVDTNVITGGIDPMLAHDFDKHSSKMTYPAYIQPKLDGHRCIAMVDAKGKCLLWSRTRKPIIGVPHIIKAIEKLELTSVIFDGELYNHDFCKNFEAITKIVNQKTTPLANHTVCEYHIYDVVLDQPFEARHAFLNTLKFSSPLKCVTTVSVSDEDTAIDLCEKFIEVDQYEGAILRNKTTHYENSRSYGLQKMKKFEDAEFRIIGIEEGKGKLRGHVGAFVCLTKEDKKFNVKMKGETSKLKEYFEDSSLWTGKQLTVKYYGWTGKNNVPRFPSGKCIREE